MHTYRSFRHRLFAALLVVTLVAFVPTPAHATSKEIIELQTQVQQLLDSVQRLQSTMDSRFAVVQHLAEQTADNANQMNAAVSALQKSLAAQNDAITTKLDTASSQVQSLNDSVDEVKSRLAKLDKSLQDLQAQLQTMQAPPPSTNTAPGTVPNTTPNTTPSNSTAPAPTAPPTTGGTPQASVGNAAPPLQATFEAGVSDYNAARYEVAAGEFQDVIHYYPMDDMAGTAQFYLGEVALKQLKLSEAVRDYNTVLEGFPGNSKAPAAQLHKASALLQMSRKEPAINELRLLIKRHPATPEAAQARAKLAALGVKASAAH